MTNPNVTPLRLCDIADEIFHEYLGHYETLLEPDVGKHEYDHHKDEYLETIDSIARIALECEP